MDANGTRTAAPVTKRSRIPVPTAPTPRKTPAKSGAKSSAEAHSSSAVAAPTTKRCLRDQNGIGPSQRSQSRSSTGKTPVKPATKNSRPMAAGQEASEISQTQASVEFKADENALRSILDGHGVSASSRTGASGFKGPRLTLGGKVTLTANDLGITDDELTWLKRSSLYFGPIGPHEKAVEKPSKALRDLRQQLHDQVGVSRGYGKTTRSNTSTTSTCAAGVKSTNSTSSSRTPFRQSEYRRTTATTTTPCRPAARPHSPSTTGHRSTASTRTPGKQPRHCSSSSSNVVTGTATKKPAAAEPQLDVQSVLRRPVQTPHGPMVSGRLIAPTCTSQAYDSMASPMFSRSTTGGFSCSGGAFPQPALHPAHSSTCTPIVARPLDAHLVRSARPIPQTTLPQQQRPYVESAVPSRQRDQAPAAAVAPRALLLPASQQHAQQHGMYTPAVSTASASDVDHLSHQILHHLHHHPVEPPRHVHQMPLQQQQQFQQFQQQSQGPGGPNQMLGGPPKVYEDGSYASPVFSRSRPADFPGSSGALPPSALHPSQYSARPPMIAWSLDTQHVRNDHATAQTTLLHQPPEQHQQHVSAGLLPQQYDQRSAFVVAPQSQYRPLSVGEQQRVSVCVSPSLLPPRSPLMSRDDPELAHVMSIQRTMSSLAASNPTAATACYPPGHRRSDRDLGNPLLYHLDNQFSPIKPSPRVSPVSFRRQC
eukprot:scpid32031/ scgid5316/ 